MTLSLKYKALIALALLTAAYSSGWYSHRPIVQTKTDTKVQTVDHIVTQTKIVTVKVPNGTTTTTVETTKVQEAEKTRDTASVASVQTPSRYSLGLDWSPSNMLDRHTYMPSQFDVGYRVVGPVWATAAYNWTNHGVLIGLRLDF